MVWGTIGMTLGTILLWISSSPAYAMTLWVKGRAVIMCYAMLLGIAYVYLSVVERPVRLLEALVVCVPLFVGSVIVLKFRTIAYSRAARAATKLKAMMTGLHREKSEFHLAAQRLNPIVVRLLNEIGTATWGQSRFGRRYSILGPTVDAEGVEWALRRGKWDPTDDESTHRAHEYFTVRLAFDGGQASFFALQCAELIGSHDVSPAALRALTTKARRLGPARTRRAAKLKLQLGLARAA